MRIDDRGLRYRVDGADRLAGGRHGDRLHRTEPASELIEALAKRGVVADCIGGARLAAELDAARAIDEGPRLVQTF